VARFPVPVVTGIGHARDDSILDEIACVRTDTPSKAAAYLVNSVTGAAATALDAYRQIMDAGRSVLTHADREATWAQDRVTRAARARVTGESERVNHTMRTVLGLTPKRTLERGYAVVRTRPAGRSSRAPPSSARASASRWNSRTAPWTPAPTRTSRTEPARPQRAVPGQATAPPAGPCGPTMSGMTTFTPRLSEQVQRLRPSSTIAVTARALELQRAGVDVLSMAAGEPDFDTPPHVVAAAKAAIDAGRTRYTQVQGIPELREAIAAKLLRENGLTYTPDQVTVGNGGKQSLFNAFFALLDPGDEVLIPSPYWVSYPEMVRFAGGVPVAVPTRPEDAYRLDPDVLRAAVTPRTKMIVLNSPGNPTGAVFPEATLRAVADLAQERG